MRKPIITICIDRSLLERIDETRGLIPRSAWIEDHLKKGCPVRYGDAAGTF